MNRGQKRTVALCCMFFIAMVASMVSTPGCLFFTALFWSSFLFVIRGKILRDMPVLRDMMLLVFFIPGYPVVLYMVMGLGDDVLGLLKAICNDITGVWNFPLYENAKLTLQMTVREMSKVRECITLVIRKGGIGHMRIRWNYHYLMLGLVASWLVLITALRCILSALAALPGCLSEWLKSRKEAKPEAEATA